MAYNITAPGTGTVFATDDIGGIHYPRNKMAFGPEGGATDVSADSPLPVATASDPASDIFEIAPNSGADITNPETETVVVRVLDVITAGTVAFVTASGKTRSFATVPAGYSFRGKIARVLATTTTRLFGHV